MNSTANDSDEHQWNPDLLNQIPEDFPYPKQTPGSIGGFQAKVLMTEYEGQFYISGTTPRDRWARWDRCEDLVQQLKEKCLESKAGKRAHLQEVDILDQYFERLLKTNWTSPEEAQWVIRRIAGLLSWPVPESANAL
ncbi:hypothetical protein [Undibacterium terreum]|uniref:Uncharacterized protein n=1 Tax=Undibacterium terreum TaxID=1224302 RepID=A0A916XQV1_9BURK|nr:hypothetical protein [Undibacterium terreum]GGC93485.1 hypothetical protein GCM10011396_45960 [Undibacterium terreum]